MHSEFVLSLFSRGGCFLDLLLTIMFSFPNNLISQVICLYITSLVFQAIIYNSALHLLLLRESSLSKNLCWFFLLLWGLGVGCCCFFKNYFNYVNYILTLIHWVKRVHLLALLPLPIFVEALTMAGSCLLDWALHLDEETPILWTSLN